MRGDLLHGLLIVLRGDRDHPLWRQLVHAIAVLTLVGAFGFFLVLDVILNS
ncbi:MAG: hypothetical protein OXE43_05980 [Chloroflexi bacterium]|nr:hypothetical protein [Chloroflexota bacterium]